MAFRGATFDPSVPSGPILESFSWLESNRLDEPNRNAIHFGDLKPQVPFRFLSKSSPFLSSLFASV
jgi:hypothetical protein